MGSKGYAFRGYSFPSQIAVKKCRCTGRDLPPNMFAASFSNMKHAGQLHIYTTVIRERLVCKVYEDVVSVYMAFDYKL